MLLINSVTQQGLSLPSPWRPRLEESPTIPPITIQPICTFPAKSSWNNRSESSGESYKSMKEMRAAGLLWPQPPGGAADAEGQHPNGGQACVQAESFKCRLEQRWFNICLRCPPRRCDYRRRWRCAGKRSQQAQTETQNVRPHRQSCWWQ